jgi:class 3 adenylate cyclase
VVVSSDRLLVELWGAETTTDKAALRVRISQLRKALLATAGEKLIETRTPGYVLQLGSDQLDLHRHARLLEQADAAFAEDPARAAAWLGEALALWRGPPLADFAYEPFAQTAIGRLEELRLSTLEKRIDAELALGLERELAGELQALVAEHPLRERFRVQLMLALYRAGRQAEALDVYQQARRFLVDELGIEPSPELQKLHSAVLAQDRSLQAEPLRARPSAPSGVAASSAEIRQESRKTVTVLFCDVVESTSLGERFDAEVMRRVMERYFETGSEVLRGHGGTVEKFIGDAVMAVFGIPTAHEDDALRAVRAAIDLRRALAVLNDELEAEWKVRLSTRIGLDTGEVVAGDAASGHAFVTGEAANVAARLQQAAEPDEVLLGEATWRLVRAAVRAEFASLLTLKGKGREVAAWRLLDINQGAPSVPRRFDTPFVGRVAELAQLRSAYERTWRERAPCLFTVFGEAGIGKTRLAEEARLDLLAEARVFVGRCLPYGEGVTFAAFREIVRQALGDKPREALRLLLAEEPDGARVAEMVSGLFGLSAGSFTLEEGFGGARRLCEAFARPRPLVLVFEDVHWAEPTMLDLIEFVAEDAHDSPILLLCLARHELLDQRPQWGGGKLNATSIALEPLLETESEQLANWLIRDLGAAGASSAAVVEAAQGNPLFVEQLVAMLADGGWEPEDVPLPSTVEALLAARLERLGPGERLVLEHGSVLGDRFRVTSLAELVSSDLRATLPEHLRALVRKELLRPARLAGGDDGYRFRHILVREAAYRRLPKGTRAELHERFADWLESAPERDRTGGSEELLGYHLERAHSFRAELGPADERVRRLAERASHHLAAAAAEAFARTDWRAVEHLLARATAMIPSSDSRRATLLYDRGTSLLTLGRLDEADTVLAEAIEAARTVGDERSEWRARVDRLFVQAERDPAATTMLEHARLARDARSALERLDDDRGLARAWLVAASVPATRGQAARMEEAARQTLRYARRSGVYREEAWALWWLAEAILKGPTPVAAGSERCEKLLERRHELRVGDVGLLGTLALFRAMEGEFDRGRQLIRQGRELIESLGHGRPLLATMCWRGELELLAGEPAAAEASLSEAHERAVSSGSAATRGEIAPLLARALLAQGRGDEAERFANVARAGAPADSRPAQAGWRAVLAAVFAERRRADAAIELAAEAARLLRATDLLPLRADVFMSLATALTARGDTAEAARTAEQALALYEQKGNLVAARRARSAIRPLSGQA